MALEAVDASTYILHSVFFVVLCFANFRKKVDVGLDAAAKLKSDCFVAYYMLNTRPGH